MWGFITPLQRGFLEKKSGAAALQAFQNLFLLFFAGAQELAAEKFQEQAGWMSFTIW
ncbi:MAG: hypothetical protein QWI73_05790 [Alphaproteobacteria bacterium]|nr:hypothetical protein [Alphaproteobacteria bacterium]